jgi:iron complex transport system substrate-binding protein
MRIISLLPGATDAITALGGIDLLVGVSHECDAPVAIPRVTSPAIDPHATSGTIDAAVRDAARVGTPLFTIDAARIVALRPDLIVTQALCAVCAVNEADVRALAATMTPTPRVLSVSGASLDGVFADVVALGSAADLGADADELVMGLRGRMRAVHETLKAARAPRPRVAVIEWTDPLYAGGHWVPEQVKRAGGVDVLSTPGSHSLQVSAGAVREADPEIVIVAPCGFSLDRAAADAAQLLAAHTWLRGRQLWAIDANALTSRPGPRLVAGIEVMACLFAPALFPPVSARAARRLA